ncbi:MAG: Calx-beta domain-containing protein [Verrucomicrobiia bacterium]
MARTKSFLWLLWLACVPLPTASRADLSFTLTPAVQSGAVSNEVVFTGTLNNMCTTNELFLNDIQISFIGAATNYLSADTNTFYANVPGILLAGETYSDVVFGVGINAGTPPGDYFGVVTILAGSNVFAEVAFTSLTFQVSSPAVSIVAGTADAYKFGEIPGAFTMTRVGATNIDQSVAYTIGGTASNGVDYSLIANSVTIPAGSISVPITVSPIDDGIVVGDVTVTLTLSNSAVYNLGSPASATVTVHDTPFNDWRLTVFGTNANDSAISGDLADPDGDGIVNLLKYALDLNPNVASVQGLPTSQIDPACACLTLT